MYFFPKEVSNLPRAVLPRKPIPIRYGRQHSNIEESSPNPAAIESKPIGILLFCLENIYCLSKESNPFSSI